MKLSRMLSRHAGTFAPALAVALAMVALAGCDGGTGPTVEEDLTGIWESATGAPIVVEITETTFHVYDGSRSTHCYDAIFYDISARNGTLLTLSPEQGDLLNLDVQRNGSELVVTNPQTQQSLRLTLSQVDPATLEVCTYPGAEASLDCASLTELVPGVEVSDSLTADEPTHQGFHYDLYHLQIAAGGPIHLAMESDIFDTYLRIYDADGNLIAEDDDGGAGTNAGLIAQFEAGGCYRIEATSYAEGATGPYTLTAN